MTGKATYSQSDARDRYAQHLCSHRRRRTSVVNSLLLSLLAALANVVLLLSVLAVLTVVAVS